jgi:hypothetical protein
MLVVAPPSQVTRLAHSLSQLQTWAALQAVPSGQAVGQLNVPPHPSPMSPQYCPPSAGLQEILWQAGPPTHTFLLPHTQSPLAPAVEQSVPQSTARPQPSPTIPQYWPPAAGLQEIAGQSFGPLHKPSWQVHPALAHVVPQSTFPPHLSPSTPQYWSLFAVMQARGVHTSGPPLHMPSVPQAQPGLLHVFPHGTSPPHPSPMLPQY